MKKVSHDGNIIQEILNDKTSGSTDLLQKLNTLLSKNLDNPGKLTTILSEASEKLGHFRIIANYISIITGFLKTENFSALMDYTDYVKNYNPSEKIYQSAKSKLKEISSVLTLSNSRTVTDFIKIWHEDFPPLKVIIAESRPKLEGRKLAAELLKQKINVTLITDASLGFYISRCDAVLIGADIILRNGNVVNKTGSLTAAILSGYYRKPFYVVAAKDKFSDSVQFNQPEESPDEIWRKKNKYLKIRNYYFEEIDKELITEVFSYDNPYDDK